MVRKNLNQIAEYGGDDPNSTRRVLARMKEHVLESEEHITEIQGLGVFYNKLQQEGFTYSNGNYYRLPSRNVVAMRPPRRRRSEVIAGSSNWSIRVLMRGFPDDGGSAEFFVRRGSVPVAGAPRTPILDEPRNFVFTANSAFPNACDVEYGYERRVSANSPPGDVEVIRRSFRIIRHGARFETQDLGSAANPVIGSVNMVRTNYSALFGVTAAEIANDAAVDGRPALKAVYQAAMKVMRNEV